jgi:adenosine deaminase
LEAYVRKAPKAELHVHLEGSIRPATVLELARRNGVSLPAQDLEGLRRWYVYRDFPHFVEVYLTITGCLRTAEDYELIAYEFGLEMARQNVRYAEVTFSASTHTGFGVPREAWWGGLTKGRERARSELGVEIAWVFDIVRQIEPERTRHERAAYTVDVALEGMREGVVALGLGGTEQGYPPGQFAPYFRRALDGGLHSAPHAGEHAGPESVWTALEELGAERIGHGVRSIEDPALVRRLAERGVPLEVSPTSNVRLGVYPDYRAHPLPRLLEAGVRLTVNSDDPPLFNTTLNDELALLPGAFGLGVDRIDELLLNGVRQSFLPPARKAEVEESFRAELEALKTSELAK